MPFLQLVYPAVLFLVGVINFIPITGVLGPARLAALYGVEITDPSLALLMQHRALLLGGIGALLMWAAFEPRLRPFAAAWAMFSMLSFRALVALSDGKLNANVIAVGDIDIAALSVWGFAWQWMSWYYGEII
eukprot:TRINITY_DN4696_c0_g1_i1.p1 TRINITY_DN4696_c0_g1~~TRINITY_DN4696_c0_g1_i1.p1  ORF type:complete len:132 (-),score=16.50 TRINITY_DN4696_c0_g1_i1:811-1206(-)